MIKNNNSAVTRKLTVRSLATGKMRNFFIILTVALSAALISGLSLSALSMREAENLDLEKMQHVLYMKADENQIEQIRSDSRTDEVVTYKLGKSMEVDNFIIVPEYVSENSGRMQMRNISEGSYPQEFDEIVVDKEYLKRIGHEPVLGSTLDITWIDGTQETFRISGFTGTGGSQSVFMIYFSQKYAENGSQLAEVPYSAAVRIIGAEKMSENEFLDEIRTLGADCGIERPDINENNAFVTTLSVSSSELIFLILVSISVLFVSVLVIYSIFYISVTGKIRQFGQLITLGTTSRQIRKMIKLEGILLCLAGAPCGIIIGIIFSYIIRPQGLTLRNILIVSLVVLLANMITVLISIKKPARIASAVSPIEALKSSGYKDEDNAKQKKKGRRLTPFGLAMISAKRNHKKSLMTALSLGVGGVLFMTGTTLIVSMNEDEYSRQSEYRFGEYVLSLSSNATEANEHGMSGIQLQNPLSEDMINKIKDINGVKSVMALKNMSIDFSYNNYNGSDFIQPYTRDDSQIFNRYRTQEKLLDYDEMIKNKELIVVHNDVAKEIFGWNFKAGDKVNIRWFDGSGYQEEQFTIIDTINTDKMLKNDEAYRLLMGMGWFLAPEELTENMMPENFNFNTSLVVSASDYEKDGESIENELRQTADSSASVIMHTLKENISNNQYTFSILYTTVFGLSAFIIGFALINLINTLVSDAMSKKQEFAMLCSIGMTRSQLAKMIQGEGLILAVKNIIITAVAGIPAGFALILLMQNIGADYLHWHLPWMYLLGYAVMIVAAPLIISSVIIRIICKKSLVERLREIE
ncbi:MAG: ABC transporter permease [Oscillospiraceae bacterium]|nr:ABC transporter permease [Oscillospiraceae bacterium]